MNEPTPKIIRGETEPVVGGAGTPHDEPWYKRVTFWKRFHLLRVYLWAAMIPVALTTDLKKSVPFLVFLSLVAPLLGDLSSWQGARAEESADDAETIAEAVYRRLKAEQA